MPELIKVTFDEIKRGDSFFNSINLVFVVSPSPTATLSETQSIRLATSMPCELGRFTRGLRELADRLDTQYATGGYFVGGEFDNELSDQPTHWMPLPDPPA